MAHWVTGGSQRTETEKKSSETRSREGTTTTTTTAGRFGMGLEAERTEHQTSHAPHSLGKLRDTRKNRDERRGSQQRRTREQGCCAQTAIDSVILESLFAAVGKSSAWRVTACELVAPVVDCCRRCLLRASFPLEYALVQSVRALKSVEEEVEDEERAGRHHAEAEHEGDPRQVGEARRGATPHEQQPGHRRRCTPTGAAAAS